LDEVLDRAALVGAERGELAEAQEDRVTD